MESFSYYGVFSILRSSQPSYLRNELGILSGDESSKYTSPGANTPTQAGAPCRAACCTSALFLPLLGPRVTSSQSPWEWGVAVFLQKQAAGQPAGRHSNIYRLGVLCTSTGWREKGAHSLTGMRTHTLVVPGARRTQQLLWKTLIRLQEKAGDWVTLLPLISHPVY